MTSQGLPVSIAGVAEAYHDFLDVLVVDVRDTEAAEEVRQTGLRVHVTKTIMRTPEDKTNLASEVLATVAGQSAARAGTDAT